MPLEAKNLYFKFPKQESWTLEDCNIRIEQGERLVILAPSGYGKTTLALLLAGYLKPDKGQILWEEKQLPQKGICPVQLIFQHPEKAINPRWKLKKVLEEVGEIPEGLLTALGIEMSWLDRFPGELSGGELQRFCVARALMTQPRYLICDEISTMLDTITQAQIWQVILEEAQKRNLGLLIITHNRHLAKKVGSRIIELY